MLLQQMRESRNAARLARDTDIADKLSVIIGDIDNERLRTGKDVPEVRIVAILRKFAENCDESKDTVGAEMARSFLPKQMTDEQLQAEISTIIASGANNIGVVMKALNSKFAGTYDGKTAKVIIEQTLR